MRIKINLKGFNGLKGKPSKSLFKAQKTFLYT